MRLIRDVIYDDVETQNLDVTPGFRFTWWYSGAEVTPDNKHKDKEMTKQFVRWAEIKKKLENPFKKLYEVTTFLHTEILRAFSMVKSQIVVPVFQELTDGFYFT